MKRKHIATVLVLLITLLLSGCNDGSTNPLAAADGEYTIAVLSDTQFLSHDYPDVLMGMVKTLANNQQDMNLKYVVHTGDLVQNPYAVEQWEVIRSAFDKLVGIPYGVLAGNHDLGNGDQKFTLFLENFGEARFLSSDWYKHAHEGGRAHCDLLSMDGDDFIFVYLSDDPSLCCIEFANEMFRKYSDRIGVLCVHRYLKDENVLGDMGVYLQKAVVSPNVNIKMVLCGHEDAVGALTSHYGDRSVHAIIFNCQEQGARNVGGILLLQINQEKGTIKGFVYEDNFKGKGVVERISLPINW